MATPLPKNHAAFTLPELVAITGGTLVGPPSDLAVTHVSTDTRALQPGAVFVALVGKIHDGHAHVDAAASAGARVAIVDRELAAPASITLVKVDDTLRALGEIARAHVTRWHEGRTVIGITGSAGKTTTRVATAALVEALAPGRLLATKGNLNNRIGVPMMLLSLSAEHHTAVLELGTSERGEIAELGHIAQPDVGILTLVAAAHLDGLGSIEGVASEKGALFRALPAHGLAVGNADDPRIGRLLETAPCAKRLSYGRNPQASVHIVDRRPMGMDRSWVEVKHADGRQVAFETPLIGEAGALACAAALVTVEALFDTPLDGPWLTRAFAAVDVSLGAQRLVPHRFANGLAVIDDTYNANPISMAASIQAASEMATAAGRRLVLVLGEMRELGSESARGHDGVGEAATRSGAALVVAVGGGHAERIAARAREGGVEARFQSSVDGALLTLGELLREGDLVLVKASRSVGADRIVRELGSLELS
ncbi:MAG: UDP-N-acetylmuramoyl-tripeptide--D-alanyl-D-alanine ligase [Polyangiaceae bacterium]